jgi:rhodanese-related sulfurtransferase
VVLGDIKCLGKKMMTRTVLYDLGIVVSLFAISISLGVVINSIRSNSLSLAIPKANSQAPVREASGVVKLRLSPARKITADDVREITADRSALILDARPQVFYVLAHIPSALSLPRDDFEKQYAALNSTMSRFSNKPIIVYCDGDGCPDSEMVAGKLLQMGYRSVYVFPGGWEEWEQSGFPEEKEGS